MRDDGQQKLDDLYQQIMAMCSRINATRAGPEREELGSKLAALDRVRFLLWQDTDSDETKSQIDLLPSKEGSVP